MLPTDIMKTNPIHHLYFRAKAQPHSIAIQRLDGAVSYGQLLKVVRRIAYKLTQDGILPGQVIVTRMMDKQTEWLLTLAIMHEAAVSCSAHGASPLPPNLDPDVIVTGAPLSESAAGRARVMVIDQDWFNTLPVPAEDSEPRCYDGEENFIRLALSSGTTGKSKVIALTARSLVSRCENATCVWSSSGKEVSLFPLSTILGCLNPMHQLLNGGTLFLGQFEDQADLLATFQIEYVFGSPMQLLGLCQQLADAAARPASVKMAIYSGGQASPRLLDKIRTVLCPSVVCVYGSTEIGRASLFLVDRQGRAAGEAGYVLPEASVEIVDEWHNPLGFNREGIVRTRTPHMATGYYADEEATRRSFHDGWFYPGDRGWLREDGMLMLAGREKELINRGGVKVDPAAIDRHLLDYKEIEDAAAFGFENAMGIEDVAVAVVSSNEIAFEQVRNSLIQALGLAYRPSALIRVETIPRNDMGKPLRGELRSQCAEGLRADGERERERGYTKT